MGAAGSEVAVWAGIGLNLALMVVLPLAAWWRTGRPGVLRDAWLFARRGTVPAVCVAAMVVLAVVGVLIVMGAVRYPFLWSTVALIAGAEAAVAIYLARYAAYGRRTIDKRAASSPSEARLDGPAR